MFCFYPQIKETDCRALKAGGGEEASKPKQNNCCCCEADEPAYNEEADKSEWVVTTMKTRAYCADHRLEEGVELCEKLVRRSGCIEAKGTECNSHSGDPMKFNDLIRYAIVLATLGYFFGGDSGPRPPKPEPVPCVIVEPYTGSMTGLHQTSRSMDSQDRIWLSDAFTAGGDMVKADGRGLIADTEKAQSIRRGHIVL